MTRKRAERIAPLLAFLVVANIGIEPISASLICKDDSNLVGSELPLQSLTGRLRVFDDCSFEVQELRWQGEAAEICSWWAYVVPSAALGRSSRGGREEGRQELRLRQYGLGQKERVGLPEGISWDAVLSLQLRCLGQSGALAWAEVPHGVSRGVSQGYAAQRRRLQEGMSPALLSSYPGQEADSAVSNSNSASSVPGNPQPLFPPPPGPPRTSADVAGSQRLEFSPNAEAATFSAVDVSGGPSVTVVDNSPGLPTLGAYPGAPPADPLITAPPAFPDFSSPDTAAAASQSPDQATPSNPTTTRGADDAAGDISAAAPVPAAAPAAAPQTAKAAVPPAAAARVPPPQAAAAPKAVAAVPPTAAAAAPPVQATPVPTPSRTPAPTPTPTATAVPPAQPAATPAVAAPTNAAAAPTPAVRPTAQAAAPPKAAANSPAATPAPTAKAAVSVPAAAPMTPAAQPPDSPAAVPDLGGTPTDAATVPAPAPTSAAEVAAALSQYSPGALGPATQQNLSSLALSTGQDLGSVNGQNLTGLGGANVGELVGSTLGGGNTLAPAPAPVAAQLINSVVPPSVAIQAPDQSPANGLATPAAAPSNEALPPAPAAPLLDDSAAAAALENEANQASSPSQATDAALAAALAAAATPPTPAAAPVAPPKASTPAAPPMKPPSRAPAAGPKASAPSPAALSGTIAAPPTQPPAAVPAPAPVGALDDTSSAAQDLAGEAASAPAPAQGADDAAALAAALAAANTPPPALAPVPSAAAPLPVPAAVDAAAAAAAALAAAGQAPAASQSAIDAAIAGELAGAQAPTPAPSAPATGTVPSSVALAPSFYDSINGGGAGTQSVPVAAPAPVPVLAPMLAPAPAAGASASGAAAPAPSAYAQPLATSNSPPSDADLANAAIAALYAPPPLAQSAAAPAPAPTAVFSPQVAPAPAPRNPRVSSSSLADSPTAAPEQPPPYAPPPLGNVTLTFTPPAGPAEDLGYYPGDANAPQVAPDLAAAPSAAGPAAAPETGIAEIGGGARRPTKSAAPAPGPGGALLSPQLAPVPSLAAPASGPAPSPEATASGGVAAPIQAPAPGAAFPPAAPVQAPAPAAVSAAAPATSVAAAPAPGPPGQQVVNLALSLDGPGLANLSPANKAAIQQALAKQLNLAPEQITVVGTRAPGPAPTRRRTMLQQAAQPSQASLVDVQIRPSPDQTAGLLAALSQSSFPAAFKDQLASAGLPVQSAGVAAVTQSSAQSPPVAASPAPPSKEKMAEERDAALEGQNLKMIRIHGWLMFTAFIIFLPFAILTAFAFKNWQPYWFYVHITAIVLALVSAAAGLVIGFTLIQDDMYEWVHKWVGTAVVAALLLQVVLAFLIRPPPDSHMRKYWNIGHYWWGRLILVVSLGNFFFGIWMLHSTPILYIVPAAILLFWCFVGLVKELFSYMRMGSRKNSVNAAETLRMDYHMRGSGNGARKPIQELYSSPLPGNGATLHTRPSYLGAGGNPAYGNPHSGGSTGWTELSTAVNSNGGVSPRGKPQKAVAAAGGPLMPPSAFAVAGRGNGGDWGDEDEGSLRDAGGPSGSNMPRPPLHPLPTRGSFTSQLPPRPSELLKEGKVGAGEQIIARRRQRRLVPEGVPLNSRLSGGLSGNLDANIGKRAADAYRPRPRPSRILSTPPQEMFADEDIDSPPAHMNRPAAAGHGGMEGSPTESNQSTDENDLPPAVKARINSYYK